MDYRAAAREIAKGNIHPVYLCYGSEPFLMQEFLSFAVEKIVEPDHRDFAVGKFDLEETPVQAVIEDAETPPFLVQRKIVIAHNAVMFTAAKDASKVEHDLNRLLAYALSPVEYATVIFTVHAEKLDERKKIVKALKDKGAVVPFAALSSEVLAQWVIKRAEARGIRFAERAVDALLLCAGTNLQSLSAELEKLALFAGREGIITPEIVEGLVVQSPEQNVFLLIEHTVRLHLDKALALLAELLRQREEPVKIVMLMARQFRMMLQIKDLKGKGFSQQQMAAQLGAHPYAVKIAEEQARSYELPRLRELLAQLAELDYAMKSGAIDKPLGLELFLLRLAG